MLGDGEVDEEGNVLMTDDQDTELLDKDVEEREINVSPKALYFAICLFFLYMSWTQCEHRLGFDKMEYRLEQPYVYCVDVPLKLLKIELEHCAGMCFAIFGSVTTQIT